MTTIELDIAAPGAWLDTTDLAGKGQWIECGFAGVSR